MNNAGSDSQFSLILLDRYRFGDGEAANELWSRYANRLAGLVRKQLSGQLRSKIDPDDILQTTFADFFQKADRNEVYWKKEGDLWRLLAAIAVNHVGREAEHFAAAKRNPALETKLDTEVMISSADEASAARRLSEILESVLHNENSFSVRVLHSRLTGLSTAEIATVTGRSERTVRRVLQMLKTKLMSDAGFSLTADSDETDPPVMVDFSESFRDYDLLKMVGAGTFGKVYLARDNRNDRLVAVKALRRDWLGNTEAERLFLNEAKLLASIEHQNVVRFFGAGPLPNGSWFLVTEYADGSTLDRRFASETVTANQVLKWIHQISDALKCLHEHGIVHGDLKPANIVVRQQGVCLIDFGFSWKSSGSLPGLTGGTRGYIAPETQTSFAADVYALGKCILFIVDRAKELFVKDKQLASLCRIAELATVEDPKKRPAVRTLQNEIFKLLEPGIPIE